MPDGPFIYLIAGEESGDQLGGRLMQGLRELTNGRIRFAGVGGAMMQAEGLTSLFPMSDMSVMGVTEVIGRLPLLLRRIRQTRRDILRRKPDVVVTIDAPDFSFRVARYIRRHDPGIRLVHYIAPTVWAWRPGRAAKISRYYNHLLAVLPFEPPYFTKVGLACTFVGHPALENRQPEHPGAFAAKYNLAADDSTILLLPGSRPSEIEYMMPLMIECARKLAASHPGLVFVTPTFPHLKARIEDAYTASGVRYLVTDQTDKPAAFAAAKLALATSGTVALELGIAGIPSVICYRTGAVTAFIARCMVKLRYVSLVNLIVGREVMPEYLQAAAVQDHVLPALAHLLDNGSAREEQKTAFAEARAKLTPADGSSGLSAARVVLGVLGSNHSGEPSDDRSMLPDGDRAPK